MVVMAMGGNWPDSDEEYDDRRKKREFLTDRLRKRFDFSRSDQSRLVKEPPFQKPHGPDEVMIELPGRDDWSGLCRSNLAEVISSRRSRRKFHPDPLSLEELSFLLWATQGIRDPEIHYFRNVPSAGARHSFETYLAIGNVDGIEAGLYRYLPKEHSILQLKKDKYITMKTAASSFGQMFIGTSALVFIWAAVPYRMEWRYGPAAHRVIAFDVGHVCQNLYLAAEGIGAGTCGIGAYDQEKMDELIGVDGEDEFTIYLAPVGKV